MQTGHHKVAKASGGRSHFAEITVAIHESEETRINIEADIQSNEWKEAILFGIGYAIANTRGDFPNLSITVKEFIGVISDTSHDSVSYAAIYATWDALNDPGTNHPQWNGGKVIFPKGSNT